MIKSLGKIRERNKSADMTKAPLVQQQGIFNIILFN